MSDDIRIHRRHLPHWERAGSTYFITFRVRVGTLSPAEAQIAFDHVRAGDGHYYVLHASVVMPDHVHLIVTPNANIDLTRLMKGVKGVSARLINQSRGTCGSIWQDESYDRILRDEAEFIEKWNYILDNPVTENLVSRPADYPFLFLRDRRRCS